MSREKEHRYSEIFRSFQGEGQYTGIPTAWIRWWGCNLECKGFGQDNLDDPSTWVLPADLFDPKSVSKLEDLPVWHTGCDSSYSWAKQFRHLAHKDTISTIADKIMQCITTDHNQLGKFLHEKSKQETHLAFTGGEPMMSQASMVELLTELKIRDNCPRFITVETNGTRDIKEELHDLIYKFHMTSDFGGLVNDERGTPEWFWSVSPKLRASGEPWNKAIRPDVVEKYADASDKGQLKFVVDGSDRTWFEVDRAVEAYRKHDINWPVWIMPVGADLEMQEANAASIANAAMDRGFNVAARVHTYVYGNKIGT